MTAPPTLYLNKGVSIKHDGREYIVLSLVTLDTALVKDAATGQKLTLKLTDITQPSLTEVNQSHGVKSKTERDILEISEDEWELALRWKQLTAPLLASRTPKAAYRDVATALNVSTATLYRRLTDYRQSGLLSAFLPKQRPGGKGKGRLSAEVEAIIKQSLDSFYLTKQKTTISATLREIQRICFNAGIQAPSLRTLRLRIEWLDEESKAKLRDGAKAARKFIPLKTPIPDADWPLSLVQIDHTKLPVIIVDNKHRKPISRAWITLAIDSYSRMCLGMYLSLDAPSSMSAGACLAHAILMKNKWLERLGLGHIEWPCYGMIDVLHADNAREFRGNSLATACKEYGIDIHLRPVKQPHYGAYIERLMGTVSERLKFVKGATFANPQEKGEYDAEGNACMTLDELEKWMVLMLAEYHQTIHGGIGTSPINRWKEGILGTSEKVGRGIPKINLDPEKLRLDFMPLIERGVYHYGIKIDHLDYYHDCLRRWINSKDPNYPKRGRLFSIRRDPRDISQVYFFDPDLKQYFAIPFRDSRLFPTSIWEFEAAQKLAKQHGIALIDNVKIFKLINERRALEDDTAHKTKAARNAQQKRQQHQKVRKEKEIDLPKVSGVAPTAFTPVIKGYDQTKVQPLDDDY